MSAGEASFKKTNHCTLARLNLLVTWLTFQKAVALWSQQSRPSHWAESPSITCFAADCLKMSTQRRAPQLLLPNRTVGGMLTADRCSNAVVGIEAYGTAQGFTCQMSLAYSVMVRSEENLPVPAVDMMLCSQP
jgi:hypothetical protein